MGTAKWTEQIVERYIVSGPSEFSSGFAEKQRPAPPPPQIRYCPLCLEGYLDEKDLQNHIARTHGKEHIYLTVDDVVIRDLCWTSGEIRKCDLVLLNLPQVEVLVRAGGEEVARLRVRETTTLTKYLPTGFDGVMTIRVDGGPRHREYAIYRGMQPDFRADRLDEAIREVQDGLRRGSEIRLREYFERHRSLAANDLELRYLRGFVEYSHGLLLERRGNTSDARGRLVAAMDLLMPFGTPMATAARCVLALRMNCFSTLRGAGPGSQFALARAFFCDGRLESGGYEPLPGLTEEADVYVDPDSELLLTMLKAFYLEEDDEILRHLRAIYAGRPIRDRNYEDKLALIEARTYRRRGDRERAAFAYARLRREHPLFGQKEPGQLLPDFAVSGELMDIDLLPKLKSCPTRRISWIRPALKNFSP